MNPTIRQATLEDIDVITQIHVKAWQQSYKGLIDQAYLEAISFDERRVLREKILHSQTHCFVVEILDQMVGFCDAGPACEQDQKICSSNTSLHAATPGEVFAIYLLESYKHQGIGTQLWKFAREDLKSRGLFPFKTWVLTEHTLARAFYEKQDGRVCDECTIPLGGKEYYETCYVFESL